MFEFRTRRSRVVAQLLATLLAVPFLLPLLAMLESSLNGEGFTNYTTVLGEPMFARFFLNSALIATGSIVLTYIASILGALPSRSCGSGERSSSSTPCWWRSPCRA